MTRNRHHHDGDTAAEDLVVQINRPVAEPDSDEDDPSIPEIGHTREGLVVVRNEGEEEEGDLVILPDE